MVVPAISPVRIPVVAPIVATVVLVLVHVPVESSINVTGTPIQAVEGPVTGGVEITEMTLVDKQPPTE